MSVEKVLTKILNFHSEELKMLSSGSFWEKRYRLVGKKCFGKREEGPGGGQDGFPRETLQRWSLLGVNLQGKRLHFYVQSFRLFHNVCH